MDTLAEHSPMDSQSFPENSPIDLSSVVHPLQQRTASLNGRGVSFNGEKLASLHTPPLYGKRMQFSNESIQSTTVDDLYAADSDFATSRSTLDITRQYTDGNLMHFNSDANLLHNAADVM